MLFGHIFEIMNLKVRYFWDSDEEFYGIRWYIPLFRVLLTLFISYLLLSDGG